MLRKRTPSDHLLKEVRAKLIAEGSSLASFCKENAIDRSSATYALNGKRSGPRSKDIVDAIIAKVLSEK